MVRVEEEEIINKLQEMIGLCTEEPKHISYNEEQAIQGLLDLYNKEKEKNKELLEERKSYAEEYIHNNPWLYKQLNELYVFKTDVEKNYIKKDKIRELAKKYEHAGNGYDCTTASYKESQDIGKYLAYIELLNKEDQGNE